MSDQARSCLEHPNGLGVLKNAVLTGGAQEASTRLEKAARTQKESLATPQNSLKKAKSSRASAEGREQTIQPGSYVDET